MNYTIAGLALVTGLITGAAFGFLDIPIPAPPELPGVMGIVGIYLGYKIIERTGLRFNLLGALGLQ